MKQDSLEKAERMIHMTFMLRPEETVGNRSATFLKIVEQVGEESEWVTHRQKKQVEESPLMKVPCFAYRIGRSVCGQFARNMTYAGRTMRLAYSCTLLNQSICVLIMKDTIVDIADVSFDCHNLTRLIPQKGHRLARELSSKKFGVKDSLVFVINDTSKACKLTMSSPSGKEIVIQGIGKDAIFVSFSERQSN